MKRKSPKKLMPVVQLEPYKSIPIVFDPNEAVFSANIGGEIVERPSRSALVRIINLDSAAAREGDNLVGTTVLFCDHPQLYGKRHEHEETDRWYGDYAKPDVWQLGTIVGKRTNAYDVGRRRKIPRLELLVQIKPGFPPMVSNDRIRLGTAHDVKTLNKLLKEKEKVAAQYEKRLRVLPRLEDLDANELEKYLKTHTPSKRPKSKPPAKRRARR